MGQGPGAAGQFVEDTQLGVDSVAGGYQILVGLTTHGSLILAGVCSGGSHMSTYCTHCGAQLSGGDRFCPSCGQSTSGHRDFRVVFLAALAAALVAGGIVAAAVFVIGDDGQPVAAPAPTLTTAAPAPSTTGTADPVPLQATTSTAQPVATSTTVGELDSAELARRFGDAVWRVEVTGCGATGSGSSFAISPNHLVTNQHVVDNDSTPTLVSRSGQTLQGRVLGASYSPDIAVIETNGDLDVTLEWAPTSSVSEGDRLVTLGYPVPATDFTVTPGNVLSFGSEGGYRNFIRTDGQIDYGNSGGPSLNTSGGVVGVVTSLDMNWDGAHIVPQIFASDILRPVVDAMIDAPSYPEPLCESTTFEPPPTDYTEFWTVIVASLPTEEYDYDRAYNWAFGFFMDTGLWADVLLSDLYPSLNPGYWAVYTGYFLTQSEASAQCDQVGGLGYDCYSRLVGWSYGE